MPDASQLFVSLIGCVASAQTDTDYSWIKDFFSEPFQSGIIDDRDVRLYSDTASIVFRFE